MMKKKDCEKKSLLCVSIFHDVNSKLRLLLQMYILYGLIIFFSNMQYREKESIS